MLMRLRLIAFICGLIASGNGCTSESVHPISAPPKVEATSPPLNQSSETLAAIENTLDASITSTESDIHLGIGDPAPALSVHKWIKGAPVEEYEPGSVYIIEFWATWCGPCVIAMPHLDELAKKFKNDKLVVVALTTADENNSEGDVIEFVRKRGANYDFRYAFCENGDMYDAYMKAARQSGIPCSFVVNQSGKIAYIGHPDYLENVVADVITGTWDLERARALTSAQQQYNEAVFLLEENPERALAIMDNIARSNPERAAQNEFKTMRIMGLALAKKYTELTSLVEPQITALVADENGQDLMGLAGILLLIDQSSPHPQLSKLGKSALENGLKVGSADAEVLLSAAQMYLVLGDRDQFLEFGQKAIDIASEETKELISSQVESLKSISRDEIEQAKEGQKAE